MYTFKPLKMSSAYIYICWFLSLSFLVSRTLFKPKFETEDYNNIYETTTRIPWACSICWIVYACHQLKSGGIIRRFLSSLFWQPLAKLWLSFYLVHFVYLNIFEGVATTPAEYSLIWHLGMSVVDITISLIISVAFYLLIEAPIANFLSLIWPQKTEDTKSSKVQIWEFDIVMVFSVSIKFLF